MTEYYIVIIMIALFYLFTIITTLTCLFMLYMSLFGDIVIRRKVINEQRKNWEDGE